MTREALEARRKAIVSFLGQTIFRDREYGAALAARVYADSPMPEIAFEEGPGGRPLAVKLLTDAPRPEIWDEESREKKL
jgi:hypothetical protein